ncbi:MAG: cation:proton antiporter [Cellulosilyticaceae bacterium]
MQILVLIGLVILAMVMGRLVSKLRLPAILGWLLTGMIVGPYALGWMSEGMMTSGWFHALIGVGEIAVGFLIGTELIWKDIKKSGKQIGIICLTEAMGTFIVVTIVFAITCAITGIPIYMAFIFGAIALATAPAPSLSIINEYKAKGPVTKTLIPLAALDDVIALVIFFLVIGIVSNRISGGGMPLYMVPLMIILPIALGGLLGWLASFVLKPEMDTKKTRVLTFLCIVGAAATAIIINEYVLPSPMLNVMLVGVSFSATIANLVSKERIEGIMRDNQPIIGLFMIVVILNLGAPLDYHLILGAGIFTAIYIVSRAIGKIGGAYTGAVISKAEPTVKKYLGLTLLPHSGVSLIFTGIAVNTLIGPTPENAAIIQGTIAAAAVINEIIAVFLAKEGFKRAGEING